MNTTIGHDCKIGDYFSPDVFKSIVSKEIRSSKIENKLKTKLSNKLNKLREPTAYVTSKKIDVNMMGYDIKFIKP